MKNDEIQNIVDCGKDEEMTIYALYVFVKSKAEAEAGLSLAVKHLQIFEAVLPAQSMMEPSSWMLGIRRPVGRCVKDSSVACPPLAAVITGCLPLTHTASRIRSRLLGARTTWALSSFIH